MTSPSALICGVTSSAIPEKNGVNVTSRLVVAAVPVTVLLLHVGHEELVGAGLDDGLLIVQRRDARARQHARIALRLEQLDERVEVADVERERERGAERLAREPRDRDCRAPIGRGWPASGGASGGVAAELAATREIAARDHVAVRLLLHGGPVHAGLEAVAERDLDDLRFEHHLALRRAVNALEVLADRRAALRACRARTRRPTAR